MKSCADVGVSARQGQCWYGPSVAHTGASLGRRWPLLCVPPRGRLGSARCTMRRQAHLVGGALIMAIPLHDQGRNDCMCFYDWLTSVRAGVTPMAAASPGGLTLLNTTG